MSEATFRGGVHMPDGKSLTSNKEVIEALNPDSVVVSLQQHIGAGLESLVKVGDHVLKGQKIGDSKAFLSVPVHSPISGDVVKILDITTPSGVMTKGIEIKNDFKEELGYEETNRNYESLSNKEILDLIREKGLVGLGGAAFPTHIKLSPPDDVKIDTVIVNGAECEPYLTADQKIMELKGDSLITGLKIAMKVVGAKNGIIAIESNKPKAIKLLSEKAGQTNNIKVVSLKPKYPQGDEKRIIDATTGRIVPSGALPMNVGVVVVNAYSTVKIYEAVVKNSPLIERIVTVTGEGVVNPINVLTKVGVSLGYLIEKAGGFNGEPAKVIVGGPMMGEAQFSIDAPSVKATGGILVINKAMIKDDIEQACIRCGKCVDVCPVYLEPPTIVGAVKNSNYDMLAKLHIMDCIECGSCSYICPSKKPILATIRIGKGEIRKKSRRN